MGEAILAPVDMMNEVGIYAASALSSERARVDSTVGEAVKGAIEGQAIYLPQFLGEAEAQQALKDLTQEFIDHVREEEGREITSITDAGLVAWSKHCKYEDPTFSPTFKKLVAKMEQHFDCDAFATRLNVYRDGTDWKPFHHDSHAFHKGAGSKEDFTMGLSLGSQRTLEFMHVDSKTKFGFPQGTGDCFAFTSVANREFQHGVPRGDSKAALRISLIAWGRRRSLNTRNSAASDRDVDSRGVASVPLCPCGCRAPKKRAPSASSGPKAKKKSRLQGGAGRK